MTPSAKAKAKAKAGNMQDGMKNGWRRRSRFHEALIYLCDWQEEFTASQVKALVGYNPTAMLEKWTSQQILTRLRESRGSGYVYRFNVSEKELRKIYRKWKKEQKFLYKEYTGRVDEDGKYH